MGQSPTAAESGYETFASAHPQPAPSAHAQFGPQLQPGPQRQLAAAAGAADLQPHVHAASVQDAQVQTFETFDALSMVDSL